VEKRYIRRTRPGNENNLTVSIVVPAYNEVDNIAPLMEKFQEMFAVSKLAGEVILVDDGSTDRTFLKAKECQERYRFLKVIGHKRNRGLTEALMTGFNLAKGEIFVFWPADLQYRPEDIPPMIEKINEGYDVVCGWKKGKYGFKRLVSFIYNNLCRFLFRIKVHDLNSVKAFRREVLENLPLRKDWHRYMVVMAAEQGFRISEVKVKLYPRLSGKSKFSFWRIPIGFLDLLSVKFQLTFLKKPMLLFGSSGIVLIFLGFLVGLVDIYLRYVLHEGSRLLLYLVILLVLSGISFFALGFLSEALVALKDEIVEMKGKLSRISSRTSFRPRQFQAQKPRNQNSHDQEN
jgi:glycosyltransferase involved in cell wall biosynthesis